MGRSKQKTLVDYLVLAITPALLVLMLTSLAGFLISCFYGGQHDSRLKFIAACFVMGCVLLTRISIEEGQERAALFGIPLALAMLLAVTKFVQAGLFFNILLIAVIWWSAHKLTWDSTVIDDDEGSTGEGLLQTAGLDGEHDAAAQAEPMHEAFSQRQGDEEPAAKEEDHQPAEPKDYPLPRWLRWIERERGPHNPGTWVVYFALASVPLLAIGNWVAPPPSRGAAFRELAVYVAAAMLLLLATSFLGLRKYLRQRQLQMPLEMAGVWMLTGAGLILGVMILCLLLPRPGMSINRPQWLTFGAKPLQQASQYAQGSDAADSDQGRASGQADRRAAQGGTDAKGGQQSGGQQSGGQQPGGQQSGGQQSGGQQSGGQQSGGQQSGGQQSGGQQSGGQQSGGQQSGGQQSGGQQSGGQQSGGQQSGGQQSGGQQSGGQQSGGQQSGGQQSGGQQSGGQQSGGQQSGGQQSGGQQSGGQQSGGQQSGGQQSGGQQSGGQQSGGQQSGGQQSGGQQSGGQQSGAKGGDAGSAQSRQGSRDPTQEGSDDPQADGEDASSSQGGQAGGRSPNPSGERGGRAMAQRSGGSQPGETSKAESRRSGNASAPRPTIPPLTNLFGGFLQLVYWVALIGAAVFVLARYWRQILDALRKFLEDLRNFWARLFGRRTEAEAAAEQAAAAVEVERLPGWSDFSNPFRSDSWRGQSAEQLVQYSFQALEAWARDHGCPRLPDQTPLEFVAATGRSHPPLQQPAQALGQLYSHAAYGPRQLPARSVTHLQQLWESLESLERVERGPSLVQPA